LRDSGTTILLTTHYLDEAAKLADRVGVLTGGKIVAEAPPEQLGGAAARVPVVRWRDDAGGFHAERTEQPARLIAQLSAAAGGQEPAELEVRRPSLEEVYLALLAAEAGAAGAAGPAGATSPAAPTSPTGPTSPTSPVNQERDA